MRLSLVRIWSPQITRNVSSSVVSHTHTCSNITLSLFTSNTFLYYIANMGSLQKVHERGSWEISIMIKLCMDLNFFVVKRTHILIPLSMSFSKFSHISWMEQYFILYFSNCQRVCVLARQETERGRKQAPINGMWSCPKPFSSISSSCLDWGIPAHVPSVYFNLPGLEFKLRLATWNLAPLTSRWQGQLSLSS